MQRCIAIAQSLDTSLPVTAAAVVCTGALPLASAAAWACQCICIMPYLTQINPAYGWGTPPASLQLAALTRQPWCNAGTLLLDRMGCINSLLQDSPPNFVSVVSPQLLARGDGATAARQDRLHQQALARIQNSL